ncbi:Signal peptide peptidase-like 2B [Orchesella cincta]|uniref:Signal peptide peptidase-like 2B n=1 Tax=Orchesella cincta TaxID=48709 RepID=A0A1D2NJ38_ORCCI|nr:Signal peptide peptidase-like 2B [Orchesella cincta]
MPRITAQEEPNSSVVQAPDNSTKEFCFFYQSNLFTVPSEPEKVYKIVDSTTVGVCEGATPTVLGNNTLLLLEREVNCSVSEYIKYAKDSHGAGFFINVYNKSRSNDSSGLDIFGAISNQTLSELKKYIEWRSDISVQVFSFEDSFFDGSILLLWVTACICVAVGSLTGPYQDMQSSTSSRQQILESSSNSSAEPKNVQVQFTVTLAMILVVFITATLLLLYYFYDYLVYFFMGVFCLASGRATYEILNQIVNIFKVDAYMPRIRGCAIHKIFLAGLCTAFPVLWFIFRHNSSIWILQDFLGICFCVHLIQTLRMSNLQICAVLLSSLFIYDIFFVFITPYITSNGKSVMVEVATGGNSGESLPLLIKFPRTRGPAPCRGEGSYSLLGFGDIIVPGFLVCFAHSFDIIIRGDKRRPYFITTMIGYGIGLAVAFVALYISQTGQPALLYIVPCTLIPISVLGLIKRQFRDLWRGSMTITEVEP